MTLTESPTPARTRITEFRNPHSTGNKVARLVWRIVWLLLFRPTPPRLFAGWRRFLLRLFGARLGRTYVHPSVRIWSPDRLITGDDVYIDERVNLYNAYGITIGSRVIVSQGAFLCTASHDHEDPTFPLIGKPITLRDDTWVAAEAFLAPGVTVNAGGVVGARAVVVKDVEAWTVVGGNPARMIKPRTLRQSPS